MCTSAAAPQPTIRRSVEESQSDVSITKLAYRGGPQCAHCGWRGNHDSSCPFYNPATCSRAPGQRLYERCEAFLTFSIISESRCSY
ncbi:hypothetical protein K438DRAFT_1840312 [Mycena galopus ATCC 62051]|nr:hypothetical protein K438DRAFT_1840312 [Mycena galopus ATCC 62051]